MSRESFNSPDPSVQHVIDLMGRFGPVLARAMFGGHGLYRDGVMFALVADGELYLKVDEQSEHFFASRNLKAFAFTAKGRTVQLSYHEAPPEALEDDEAMADWCRLAWQAALRAKKKGEAKGSQPSKGGTVMRGRVSAKRLDVSGGKKERHPRAPSSVPVGLQDLPNLGLRSIELLAAAGVTSLAQLQELGAVRAFVRARACTAGVSLSLLWALEGALTGRRWQDVAEADRASLLMALEDAEREGGLGRRLKP